ETKTIFRICFQFNFTQLIQVSKIQSQILTQIFTVIRSRPQSPCLPCTYAIHSATIKTLLENKQLRVIAIRYGNSRIKSENKLPVPSQITVQPIIELGFGILQKRYSKDFFLTIC